MINPRHVKSTSTAIKISTDHDNKIPGYLPYRYGNNGFYHLHYNNIHTITIENDIYIY